MHGQQNIKIKVVLNVSRSNVTYFNAFNLSPLMCPCRLFMVNPQISNQSPNLDGDCQYAEYTYRG